MSIYSGPSVKLVDSSSLWLKRVSGFSIITSFVLSIIAIKCGIETYLENSALNSSCIVWTSTGLLTFAYFVIRLSKMDSLKRDLGSLFPQKLKQFLRNSVAEGACKETPFYKDYKIPSLPGYWFPASRKENATVILFGGNTPNPEDCHHMDFWVCYYRRKDKNVLLLDPPRYGMSYTPIPSQENEEAQAYLNACQAHQFALEQGVNKNKIIIHGFSQGGPMAAHLAALCPETATLILDHTYFEIEDVMSSLTPLPKCVFKLLNRASYAKYAVTYGGKTIYTSGWNTSTAVKQISKTTKIFLITGKNDHIPSAKSLRTIRSDLIHYETEGGHEAIIDEKGEEILN